MSGVAILGSTGTIGVNTLDVIARNRDRFHVVALSAFSNVDRLFEQCLEWRPPYAVVADERKAPAFRERIAEAGLPTETLAGEAGLIAIATLDETDQVMAGIVGAAGLQPTLAAARAGKRVLLANKEALVMSGDLFMQAVRENDAELLPIDSEHNAIFQCMPPFRGRPDSLDELGVTRILLTGSGGPFRTIPLSELSKVTPEQACAHPNWVMGRKISVDSATMMNKGLEIIEACWLFNTTLDHIQVVIHPQSVIHSMVAYEDGSVLAQMGNPDMRTPIAHALAWPERIDSGVADLDLFEVANLDFEAPDMTRFPCLRLSMQACRQGGTASAILNAANEVAVEAFLDGRIGYTQIAETIEHCLEHCQSEPVDSLEQVLAADRLAREAARAWIARSRQ